MNQSQFDSLLAKYAEVVVHIGLGLRAGQRLLIRGILEDAALIRQVTEAAYRAGATLVEVAYTDERLTRIRFEHADPASLTDVTDWPLTRMQEYYERMDAQLSIASSDPELLAGIAPDLIAANRKATLQKMEPLRKYQNHSNWCVVSTASPAWAQKVFPGLPAAEAQERLWQEIFASCRIDTPDPVAAWREHIRGLTRYKDFLNERRYAALHYQGPGTDLTVGLADGHVWQGAQGVFRNGILGTPNLPTEEVFTTPHKDRVSGTISATLPLNYGGVLIEDFSFTFEAGRVVNVSARQGEATLRQMLEIDEGAARLGEAALVPHSSPISQRRILFYNTLFDENAACHLALGTAYRDAVSGGPDMSDEQFAAVGGNKSLIHTDFMVGSGQLDIDGLRADGTREPVMRAGEWALPLS